MSLNLAPHVDGKQGQFKSNGQKIAAGNDRQLLFNMICSMDFTNMTEQLNLHHEFLVVRH